MCEVAGGSLYLRPRFAGASCARAELEDARGRPNASRRQRPMRRMQRMPYFTTQEGCGTGEGNDKLQKMQVLRLRYASLRMTLFSFTYTNFLSTNVGIRSGLNY